MSFIQLAERARTCRRFTGEALDRETLAALVNAARLAPCSRNMQRLRFMLVTSDAKKTELFSLIVLGGKLKPEQRAQAHQHPRGYIAILGPQEMEPFCLMDVGIAAQSIHLAATDLGLGCCMVGAFNRPAVNALFGVSKSADQDVKLVLALGKPDEQHRVVAPAGPSEHELSYFRDDLDTHCVPKLSLNELITATL